MFLYFPPSLILPLRLHDHRLLGLDELLQASVLTQLLHVQVAPARNPLLRYLDRQSRHKAQARLAVREDPHHSCATLYLLVEPFQRVGGADASAVALGEGQAGKAFLDVLFKMLCELLYTLTSPLLGHARCDPEGLLPGRCGEDSPA